MVDLSEGVDMRVLVVGAGLAGAVAARLMHDRGHKVTVIETRGHVGGNCHDEWVDGLLVHSYGPHGFHTDKRYVWDFVNRFAEFHCTALEVTANTALGLIPVPFNDVSAELVGDLTLKEIRDLIFVAYSEKHWGIPWSDIPASLSARVPNRRRGRDCRYHLDEFQGVPRRGYTPMFEAMLEGIEVILNCAGEEWRKLRYDHLIFTGSIDDYFSHKYGTMEYRSLRFEFSKEPRRSRFQINECNHANQWTRSVDQSHWLDQDVEETIICREFPCDWDGTNVRCYPKPFGPSPERYRIYRELASAERDVTFVGRLATYKYLDMDDTIAQVMTLLPD